MLQGSTDPSPLLSCRGVSKYFDAVAAVKDLEFDVQQGEVLGVGGPNGAGKTTLFDVVSGLVPLDEGRISFEGRNISNASPERVCHLGLARTFQLNAAFESLSVRDNVYCAAYYGRRNVMIPKFWIDREARRAADEAIELVGLADSRHEQARTLPVVKRKLLMLASAMACRPRLLLMDEPVGGLNPHEIDEMIELMLRLRREHALTIVLIEHVMRFLVALSDRVMIMHHGQKIYEGSTRGLVDDQTVVSVYLGEEAAERLQALFGQASGSR